MMHNPRNLLWLLPLGLLITSPLWQPPLDAFLAPRGGYNPKLAQFKEEDSPMQNFVMDRVVITMSSHGMEEWQINARRASTGERENEIEMDEVHASSLGTRKEPVDVESRKGTYCLDSRFLVLTDHVRASKPMKKQVLLSERLEYDDIGKKLVSPGKVYIQAPDMKLTAGHMEYNVATEAFDFTHRVRVDL